MEILRKLFGKKQAPRESKPIAASQPVPSVAPQYLEPAKVVGSGFGILILN